MLDLIEKHGRRPRPTSKGVAEQSLAKRTNALLLLAHAPTPAYNRSLRMRGGCSRTCDPLTVDQGTLAAANPAEGPSADVTL